MAEPQPTMDAQTDPSLRPTKMQRRDRGAFQALSAPLTARIKNSRILLVGAGGIGCELLKNLVCCGFGSGLNSNGRDAAQAQRTPGITVVDLDTIDLSNLNRQFLFRKQHIKKSKALVAKETASQFNPSVNIDAQHASIFDSQYNVAFFRSFDIVFNALDNLAARRHVNRMCLAANVPLIESGTTGFNGQVQAIRKGVTECYDCNPKPVQKSFPICTIRSTPSQPIHCIVWAKSYLLPELFGTSEDETGGDIEEKEGEDQEEVKKLRLEAQALKRIRGLIGTSEFCKAVFDKVFGEDIERLRSMEEMWQSRTKPVALHYDSLRTEIDIAARGAVLANEDQRAWTLEENLAVFCHSLDALTARVQNGGTSIDFDKDDKNTLDFVTAASNLRSHVFGITMNSEWEVKQMAGNIIPAIATSNALTASLSVMLGFKVFRGLLAADSEVAATNGHAVANKASTGLLGGSKFIFLNARSTERTITTQTLGKPNPVCPVCSPAYAEILLPEGNAYTLGDLVSNLKEQAGYEDFAVVTEAGLIYDPDLEDSLDTSLTELGITTSSNGFITITDDGDDPRVDLVLTTSITIPSSSWGTTPLTIVPGIQYDTLPLKPATPAPPAEHSKQETNGKGNGMGEKRKRGADDDNADDDGVETTTKKVRAASLGPEGEEVQVVTISDDGAIVLGDD